MQENETIMIGLRKFTVKKVYGDEYDPCPMVVLETPKDRSEEWCVIWADNVIIDCVNAKAARKVAATLWDCAVG